MFSNVTIYPNYDNDITQTRGGTLPYYVLTPACYVKCSDNKQILIVTLIIEGKINTFRKILVLHHEVLLFCVKIYWYITLHFTLCEMSYICRIANVLGDRMLLLWGKSLEKRNIQLIVFEKKYV